MSSHHNLPPRFDQQLPVINNRLPFPAGDISMGSPSYIKTNNWLRDVEKETSVWTQSARLNTFINTHEPMWLKHASNHQRATFTTALEVAQQWDHDNVPTMRTPLFVQRGFRLAHAISVAHQFLPTDYADYSEALNEMKDTFMGDETKRTNRTLLFRDAAWADIRRHPNIAKIYNRLTTLAQTAYAMTNGQTNLFRTGIGLQYTLASHTRLGYPMENMTGIKVTSPERPDPKTDAEIMHIGSNYAEERNDYNWS